MHQLTVRENLQVAQRFGAGRNDGEQIDRILELLALGARPSARRPAS